MPIAAHRCLLKYCAGSFGASGDATALVSGTTYKITPERGRNAIFVPGTSVTVLDGGVSIGNAFSADYLSGLITLNSPPSGAVTVAYTYVSAVAAIEVREFSINLTRDELEDTVMGDNNKTFLMGLKGGTGTIGSLDVLSTLFLDSSGQQESIQSIHEGDKFFALEVQFDATSYRTFRAFVKIPSLDLSGARDGLIEGSFPFTISEVLAPSNSTGKASYTFFTKQTPL